MPEEPRPVPKLEIYFIVEGQIPKFALNNFLKNISWLWKFTTTMQVGLTTPNFTCIHANIIYLGDPCKHFWFEDLFYHIDRLEMSKKGIPQRYPYKKRWYVNEINFFSKNVIIEVHTTHHFVSLWGAQRSKASLQWLWKNLLHNICKSRGSHL